MKEAVNEELERVIQNEKTHLQWPKLVLNWVMILTLLVVSLFRGDGSGNILPVIRCDGADWFLFFFLLAVSAVMTVIGLVLLKRDNQNKKRLGY